MPPGTGSGTGGAGTARPQDRGSHASTAGPGRGPGRASTAGPTDWQAAGPTGISQWQARTRALMFTPRSPSTLRGGTFHHDPRDASVTADRRAAMIHGRQDVRTASAARESRVGATGGNPEAKVNPAWGAWFLRQLVTADLDPVTCLDDDLLEGRAGHGSHEIRTGLIGFAAAGRPRVWTSYEPVPEWITGVGIGATFAVP